MTAEQRTAIYTLAATFGSLLAGYGLVTETQWAQITAMIVALIATYTAFYNRPTKP